jgi:uncharacterized protein YoxC
MGTSAILILIAALCLVIAVAIILVLVIRRVFKVNQRLDEQKKTNELLKSIVHELKIKQDGRL